MVDSKVPIQGVVVDCHCHLDLYKDPTVIVREAEAAAVEVVAVTNAPFVFEACSDLAKGHPLIHPAIGLHPQLASQYSDQRHRLRDYLSMTRFVGEVGLDYTINGPADRETQRRVFADILKWCAEAGDKFLTVHSRRAAGDVIDMVGGGFPGTVVLHWYTGSVRDLERARTFGFRFSVNPAMMESERGCSIVSRLDRQEVLTESDGPFVKAEQREAKPTDTMLVVDRLSALWHCPKADAQAQILSNFRRALSHLPKRL